jgi:hypothetical protein
VSGVGQHPIPSVAMSSVSAYEHPYFSAVVIHGSSLSLLLVLYHYVSTCTPLPSLIISNKPLQDSHQPQNLLLLPRFPNNLYPNRKSFHLFRIICTLPFADPYVLPSKILDPVLPSKKSARRASRDLLTFVIGKTPTVESTILNKTVKMLPISKTDRCKALAKGTQAH